MLLSIANVFNAMNDNFGGPQYDAEEILRTIPQGSSTPERDSAVPREKVDFSTSINEFGATFTLEADGSTPDAAFSGVERLDNTEVRTEEPVIPPEVERLENTEVRKEETALPAEEVPPVVRPLPIIRGEKSSKKRKRDHEGKHPMLNQCPETKKVYPVNELPTASGCLKTCVKGCGNHFVLSERENTHKKFWAMEYDDRSSWLAAQIRSHRPVRVRVDEENRVKKRNSMRTYFLPQNGADIEVILLINFKIILFEVNIFIPVCTSEPS